MSLKNNERLLVQRIKQEHVLRGSVKMQVALTVNINGRSRTLNSLAGTTVNDRPHSSA